jgi:hypothetical protein
MPIARPQSGVVVGSRNSRPALRLNRNPIPSIVAPINIQNRQHDQISEDKADHFCSPRSSGNGYLHSRSTFLTILPGSPYHLANIRIGQLTDAASAHIRYHVRSDRQTITTIHYISANDVTTLSSMGLRVPLSALCIQEGRAAKSGLEQISRKSGPYALPSSLSRPTLR